MKDVGVFVLAGEAHWPADLTLLSCDLASCLRVSAQAAFADRHTFFVGARRDVGAFFAKADAPRCVLIVFEPAAGLSASTLRALETGARDGTAKALVSGEDVLAICAPTDAAAAAAPKLAHESAAACAALLGAAPVAAPEGERTVVRDALTAGEVQELLRERVNRAHLRAGVMLDDPRMSISPEARIGRGTRILPGCQIYGASVIGEGCVIGPNAFIRASHIGERSVINASQVHESSVGRGVSVGPFAHLRPGCDVADDVKIGNFVEMKKTRVGRGSKFSHLAYIGDTVTGERVNFGCGAITVNYDGKKKYITEIGDDSFVGCNANLVAPVKVGRGAFVAAGTTVTEDVPDGALCVGRARQTVKPQWARTRRDSGRL